MNRLQYWLINGASLFVALLIALEIRSVHELDATSQRTVEAQAPVLQAEREAPQIKQLIQRTAEGATRDPALKDLLAKYGVTIKALPANASAVPPAPLSTATTSSP